MNKKIISLCALFLVFLVAGAAVLYWFNQGEPNAGTKTIVFELVDQDGVSEEFTITTQAEFLADALVEQGLVEYDESGMYTTIGGVTADWSDNEAWWNICKDGEALSVGMNTQVIADGEHYEAVYTNGF